MQFHYARLKRQSKAAFCLISSLRHTPYALPMEQLSPIMKKWMTWRQRITVGWFANWIRGILALRAERRWLFDALVDVGAHGVFFQTRLLTLKIAVKLFTCICAKLDLTRCRLLRSASVHLKFLSPGGVLHTLHLLRCFPCPQRRSPKQSAHHNLFFPCFWRI